MVLAGVEHETLHFTSRRDAVWFGVGGNMRAAIYARVSTVNGQSPELQLGELREYAARRG